jgi:hypothetical protein
LTEKRVSIPRESRSREIGRLPRCAPSRRRLYIWKLKIKNCKFHFGIILFSSIYKAGFHVVLFHYCTSEVLIVQNVILFHFIIIFVLLFFFLFSSNDIQQLKI